MIEDPRDVERRRQLGIEDDRGCSREDMANALVEVNSCFLPVLHARHSEIHFISTRCWRDEINGDFWLLVGLYALLEAYCLVTSTL